MCDHYKTVRTGYSKDWCRRGAEVISGKVTMVKCVTSYKDSKGGPRGNSPKEGREHFTHNHQWPLPMVPKHMEQYAPNYSSE